MSMIRKYHNYKLQTIPSHREEEPHNSHETPGRQTKQSYQLSLSYQDDRKTRMDTKGPQFYIFDKIHSTTCKRNQQRYDNFSTASSLFVGIIFISICKKKIYVNVYSC